MAKARLTGAAQRLAGRIHPDLATGLGAYIAGHSLFLLLPQALGSLVAFGLFIFLANLLPREDYGELAYARTWIMFLAPVLTLGLAVSSNKFLPTYQTKRAPSLSRGFIRFGLLMIVTTGIIIFGAMSLIPRTEGIFPSLPFRLFSPIAGIGLSIVIFLSSVDRSLFATRFAFFPRFLLVPGLFLAILAAAWSFGITVDADWAMTFFALSICASAGVQILHLMRQPGASAFIGEAEFETRIWLLTAIPILFTAMANDLLRQADMLVLGLVADKPTVAVYHAANMLSNVLALVFGSTHAVALPRIAQELLKGNIGEAERYLRLANILPFFVTLASAAVIGFFGSFLLGLFGPDFKIALTALRILLAAQVVISGLGMSLSVLLVAHRERLALAIIGIAVPLHIGAICVFYQWFGMNGAALACLLSLSAAYGVCSYVTIRLIGVRTSILSFLSSGRQP